VVDLVERLKPWKSNWPPRSLLCQPPPLPPDPRSGGRAARSPRNRDRRAGPAPPRPHDEALRAFHAGAALRFDILMDIGGFRDMHRHRRCVQIIQAFTALHGYETPQSGDLEADVSLLAEAGVLNEYQSAIEQPTLPAPGSLRARLLKPRNPPFTCCRWPPACARPVQDGLCRSPVHL
jgi:hypothetical protein